MLNLGYLNVESHTSLCVERIGFGLSVTILWGGGGNEKKKLTGQMEALKNDRVNYKHVVVPKKMALGRMHLSVVFLKNSWK